MGLLFLKTSRLSDKRRSTPDVLHLRPLAIHLPWDLVDVAGSTLRRQANVVPGKGLVCVLGLVPLPVTGRPEEFPPGYILFTRHLDIRDSPHALKAPLEVRSWNQSLCRWSCSASACCIPRIHLRGHGCKSVH